MPLKLWIRATLTRASFRAAAVALAADEPQVEFARPRSHPSGPLNRRALIAIRDGGEHACCRSIKAASADDAGVMAASSTHVGFPSYDWPIATSSTIALGADMRSILRGIDEPRTPLRLPDQSHA